MQPVAHSSGRDYFNYYQFDVFCLFEENPCGSLTASVSRPRVWVNKSPRWDSCRSSVAGVRGLGDPGAHREERPSLDMRPSPQPGLQPAERCGVRAPADGPACPWHRAGHSVTCVSCGLRNFPLRVTGAASLLGAFSVPGSFTQQLGDEARFWRAPFPLLSTGKKGRDRRTGARWTAAGTGSPGSHPQPVPSLSLSPAGRPGGMWLM